MTASIDGDSADRPWISVTEGLPELRSDKRSDDVFIWDGKRVGIGFYLARLRKRWMTYMETEEDFLGGRIHPAESESVTHWAPLLTPPDQ